jgi:hypothetical protein
MLDFDLNAIIEKLTAKVADDLRHAGKLDPITCASEKASLGNAQRVNQLEQTSLRALISWVAVTNNLSEAHVVVRLTSRFNVATVTGIDRSDFDDAVIWLVDFKSALN